MEQLCWAVIGMVVAGMIYEGWIIPKLYVRKGDPRGES